MHSDTRPYFCNICKKNLSGARIFRNHMKKHETPNSPPQPPPQPGAEPQEGETLRKITGLMNTSARFRDSNTYMKVKGQPQSRASVPSAAEHTKQDN
ncbi:hypothetical protein PAMP_002526 [Pampus punctatissimus]